MPEFNAEAEARSMGWAPKEQFKGDPDKWVDAETFIDRGRNYLPILRSNNEKLKNQYAELQRELTGVKSLLSASQEAIAALKEFQTEETKRQVQSVKKQLMEKLTKARDDDDVQAEVAIIDELADIRQAEKAITTKQVEEPSKSATTVTPPETDPELIEWISRPENSWFGKDAKKTSLAIAIGQELRTDPANKNLIGQAFYDRVAEEVDSYLGSKEEMPDKVSGGRNSGRDSSMSAGGKGYANLPADAKAACMQLSRRLVGEGRAFKTMADWQKHYATVYFSEEDEA